jgi:23S rRNA G2445 N2-methylase RlmL
MKQNNNETFFFASCPKGSEELLLQEVNSFKIEGKLGKGGVSFKSSDKKAIDFILNTRIASRVFKEMHCFFIKNEKQIYRNARNIKWDKYLGIRDTFKISTLLDRDSKEAFKNSIFLSQLLKDSLVDHMRAQFGKRPDVDIKNPKIAFLQRIEATKRDFRVQIYADMTGISLDKRGYRQKGHMAPLRENLGAAIVMSTDWKKETEKFFDPMVGSGTILVEAIMYKAQIPPSYFNLKIDTTPYSFTNQRWFQDSDLVDWYFKKVKTIIDETKAKIEKFEEGTFFANDIDESNIKLCKKHLRKCFGRIDFVTFTNDNFLEMPAPDTFEGIIAFNPPYGERLSSIEDLDGFYHDIGERLKNFYKGSRAYIFTLHGDLRKNIRLKPSRKIEFQNGDLDCRLFRYELS